jgi:hypothetical protein
MREARQSRCARQGGTDAQRKAGEMREVTRVKCARQRRADTRGQAGNMREARPFG